VQGRSPSRNSTKAEEGVQPLRVRTNRKFGAGGLAPRLEAVTSHTRESCKGANSLATREIPDPVDIAPPSSLRGMLAMEVIHPCFEVLDLCSGLPLDCGGSLREVQQGGS
jgi:hypothetical protein